jgi:hypothetical protein
MLRGACWQARTSGVLPRFAVANSPASPGWTSALGLSAAWWLREEQAKAIGQGANMLDPRWAAPAIADAWCYATMSLSSGYLERLHAEAILGAIETFASRRS